MEIKNKNPNPNPVQALAGAAWPELRSEFPILNKKTYLNTCSLGALSQHAIAEQNKYLPRCLIIVDEEISAMVVGDLCQGL